MKGNFNDKHPGCVLRLFKGTAQDVSGAPSLQKRASPLGEISDPGELRGQVCLALLHNGAGSLALGKVWTPCHPTRWFFWGFNAPRGQCSPARTNWRIALVWYTAPLQPQRPGSGWVNRSKVFFELVFFCIAVDTLPNHVKPYWPTECVTTSDGEDPRKQKLKVETKVNVELHRENQVNHSNEAPQDKENEGQQKENRPLAHQNNQQPEQRKGSAANPPS